MDNHFTSSRDTNVPPSQSQPEPNNQKKESFWGELARFAIIAVIVVFPIRMFIAQPFIVSGASMEPTFQNGQYLIVDQISYRMEEPQRGDVVIFRYPRDTSKFFIKRVIGLPGETVKIEGDDMLIYNLAHPNGFAIDETYVDHMEKDSFVTQTLGPDEYFVLGDNRDASSDSRVWGILPRENIVGRAFIRLFPVSELDLFPGHVVPEEINRS